MHEKQVNYNLMTICIVCTHINEANCKLSINSHAKQFVPLNGAIRIIDLLTANPHTLFQLFTH